MGTTKPSGYPYPEPADPVARGAANIRALAEAIDALPSTLTNCLTAAGGSWRIDAAVVYRWGRLCWLQVVATNTGSAITVPASGDIANQLLGTLVAAAPKPWQSGALTSQALGRIAGGNVNANTNTVNLTAVGGSAAIAANEQISLWGFYLTDTAAA